MAETTPPRDHRLLAIAGLALFGAGVAGYLTTTQAAGGGVVCFGLSGCDIVAASPYAHTLGIPVALLGALVYAFVAVTAVAGYIRPSTLGKLAALGVFAAACAGLAFSIYLTVIEGTVLGAYCPWCLTSAGTMLVVFLLSLPGLRSAQEAGVKGGRGLAETE